jgi:hypothetical protein
MQRLRILINSVTEKLITAKGNNCKTAERSAKSM